MADLISLNSYLTSGSSLLKMLHGRKCLTKIHGHTRYHRRDSTPESAGPVLLGLCWRAILVTLVKTTQDIFALMMVTLAWQKGSYNGAKQRRVSKIYIGRTSMTMFLRCVTLRHENRVTGRGEAHMRKVPKVVHAALWSLICQRGRDHKAALTWWHQNSKVNCTQPLKALGKEGMKAPIQALGQHWLCKYHQRWLYSDIC